MNRIEVIQKIINKTGACNYLEIGVARGDAFFRIRAKQKIAVDPSFSFSNWRKIKWTIKNLSNISATYYKLDSNDFFEHVHLSHSLDVVFIDGLHTYKQSLEDVNNSLNHLSERGVIILHDCSPPHQATAFPAESHDQAASSNLPGWTGEWCGDVWKTICHLRSFKKNLNVFVLDCDRGVGIVTRGEPESSLNLTEEELISMSYDDLAKYKKQLLNMKNIEHLDKFLKLY